MKKFLILGFLFLLITSPVDASPRELGLRGPLNFFQSKVLENIISKEVKRVVGGKINTDISSYGAKALRNGIFKSAQINGKNLEFEGIHIDSVEIHTTTENNKIDITDKSNPKLLTDIYGEYTAQITNENLTTILASPIFNKEIGKLNQKLAPFVAINQLNVFCESGQLRFKINLISDLLGSEIPISGSTKIYASNGVTEFEDIKLNKKIKLWFTDKVISLVNSLNPLNIVIKELDNACLNISVSNIKIIDDKIEIFGMIKVYRGV